MLNSLRMLLTALAFALVGGPTLATEFGAPTGEVILRIDGMVAQTNGDGSLELDLAQLDALPQTSFATSTTWTSGTPMFSGVLLKDLVAAVGASGNSITLIAINDYQISFPMADIAEDGPLLATRIDGNVLSVRDKGPIWMIFPFDQNPAYRSETRYSQSIWQLSKMHFGD